MTREYIKADNKWLRDLGLDEKWLKEKINEDPSLFGLGDLSVIERERTQPSGGRIDFLMYDPEDGVRYEIEVMLGRLDETHIIRTIEYWDIERKRFPGLQHRAVIIAEEITNRFFNIVSLLNQAVPIIAIQLNAFEIDSKVVLQFTKVLDLPAPAAEEDVSSAEKVDRSYWEKRSNPLSMAMVDKIISFIPAGVGDVRVTYNKYHIAVGTTGRNFLWLHPRKAASHLLAYVLLEGEERAKIVPKLEAADVLSSQSGRELSLKLKDKELREHKDIVIELFRLSEEYSRS